MKIRSADLKDADLLVKMRAEFNVFHRKLRGLEPASDWEKAYRKTLVKDLRSKKVLKLIACVDGEPAGTAFCRILKTHPGTNDWIESKRSALIQFVYVFRKFRGRGVATALLKKCLAWAKRNGAGIAELMVAENNNNAHRLYEKTGFRDRAIRMVRKIG